MGHSPGPLGPQAAREQSGDRSPHSKELFDTAAGQSYITKNFNERFDSNGGLMSDDDPKSRPPRPTRRKFLLTSGSSVAAGLVAGYVPALANNAVAVSDSAPTGAGPNIEGAVQ